MTAEETGPGSPSDLVSEGVMDVKTAMEFTRLSKAELYVLMGSGRLRFVKYGKRRLIPKKALIELLARGLVSAEAAV